MLAAVVRHQIPPGEHVFLDGRVDGWGDYVRLFDVFAGLLVVGILAALAIIRWRESRRSSTAAYVMGIAWGLSAVITEGRVIGTVVTPRLYFNTVGVIAGLVMAVTIPREVRRGLWRVDSDAVADHDRRHRQRRDAERYD